MSQALVSLSQAKTHLRVLTDEQDADIDMKILLASGIILDYLKLATVPAEWLVGSPVTVVAPFQVFAATLLIVGELFEKREAGEANVLSPTVEAILIRLRDPAMA